MVALALPATGRTRDRLLVIAPDRFRTALGEFVQFKQGRRPTQCVSLEEALRTDGSDDPEKLKR